MKIGVYSFWPFPRPMFGQNIRMINILKYLSKSNNVIVYCPTNQSNIRDKNLRQAPLTGISDSASITIRNFDFDLRYKRFYNDLKVYSFLEEEYERGNFDVLQLENSEGSFLLMSKCSFPKVGVFHGRLLNEIAYSLQLTLSQGRVVDALILHLLKLYIGLCERKLARRSDRVIVTSDLVKEYAINLGADPINVFVLINGVDVKKYQDYSSSISKYELRRQLNIPEDAFVFVFHGSLYFDQNIEAIRNIIKIRDRLKKRSSLKEYYFLIVGGPVEQVEKFYGADVKKIDNIFFTGYVQDIKPYLFSADCGLAPFPEDVQPGGPRLKILEFLAAGLPVITTKTGICGFEELIYDQPIYLVEKNFDDLEKLLPNLQVGTNTKKLEKFDWSGIAKKNEEILKKVIES